MGVSPIVTLLTDFGTADTYVAELKAAMLAVDAGIRFIDITHDVPPGDVAAAGYLLARSWHRFPNGTVHLVVVDPGVGTARRALAARAAAHGFVGPDNGVLTPVLDDAEVVALAASPDAAPTFHGRDVFAPAAARLASGTALSDLGEACGSCVRVPLPAPRMVNGKVVGAVLSVDRFGTLITNLPPSASGDSRTVWVGGTEIGPVQRTFADVEPRRLVAFVGSGGTIEVALRDGSAADALGAHVGTVVRLTD